VTHTQARPYKWCDDIAPGRFDCVTIIGCCYNHIVKYNPDIHHRRSIRLGNYDYSQAGAYFVTLCAQDKECLFGEINDGEMKLNEAGEMVQGVWEQLQDRFCDIELDAFIVMPNHIHGIINIVTPNHAHGIINNVGARFIAPKTRTAPQKQMVNESNRGTVNKSVINHAPMLGQIIRAFKARCAYGINKFRNSPGMPVWQRNYYERVIRNEQELNKTRVYITDNPFKWTEDENYR
jgi:putative transposase